METYFINIPEYTAEDSITMEGAIEEVVFVAIKWLNDKGYNVEAIDIEGTTTSFKLFEEITQIEKRALELMGIKAIVI